MADDWSQLFDPAASELELLDFADGPLMENIYSDNGSGWIKIAVVRDPVTRLLSAYLDIVRTWRAGLQRQEEVCKIRYLILCFLNIVVVASARHDAAALQHRCWVGRM